MTLLQRITREPAKLLALTTAVLAVLTGTHVIPTDLAAGVLGIVAAAIALLGQVVTPAAEVVVQQKPGDVAPVAGPASDITTGAPVDVEVQPVPPPDPNKVDAPD